MKNVRPAPDHLQFAYAKLVELAFVHVRNGAVADPAQLHDLADAMHNVSAILSCYGGWIDDAGYRQTYLRPYDAKWGQSTLHLETRLDDFISIYWQQQKALDLSGIKQLTHLAGEGEAGILLAEDANGNGRQVTTDEMHGFANILEFIQYVRMAYPNIDCVDREEGPKAF